MRSNDFNITELRFMALFHPIIRVKLHDGYEGDFKLVRYDFVLGPFRKKGIALIDVITDKPVAFFFKKDCGKNFSIIKVYDENLVEDVTSLNL